jgi:hypothetical protein
LTLATFIPSLVLILNSFRFKLRDYGQNVEQQPPVRVVNLPADVELHSAGGEFFDDVAGVRQ